MSEYLDDENEWRDMEPRRLIDVGRYQLTVAENSPEEDLAVVQPDLAEAVSVLATAAEWLERRGEERREARSVSFRDPAA